MAPDVPQPSSRRFASEAALRGNVDGVFQLDKAEKELVHETFKCDTRDHEDHTFCGVMFDVACDTDLPGACAPLPRKTMPVLSLALPVAIRSPARQPNTLRSQPSL